MNEIVRKISVVATFLLIVFISQAQTRTGRIFAPLEGAKEATQAADSVRSINEQPQGVRKRSAAEREALKQKALKREMSRRMPDQEAAVSPQRRLRPSAEMPVNKRQKDDLPVNNERKISASVGLSVFQLFPSDGGENTFAGMGLDLGYMITPRSRVSLEGSVNFYSYDISSRITRDYYLYPIMASWDYFFFHPYRFKLRLGASAGVAPIYATTEPVSGESVRRDTQKDCLVLFGVGTGVQCDVFSRCVIDLGYRVLLMPETTFDGMDFEPYSFQLILSFGWKF